MDLKCYTIEKKNCVTSEGAVPHNVLFYQLLPHYTRHQGFMLVIVLSN